MVRQALNSTQNELCYFYNNSVDYFEQIVTHLTKTVNINVITIQENRMVFECHGFLFLLKKRFKPTLLKSKLNKNIMKTFTHTNVTKRLNYIAIGTKNDILRYELFINNGTKLSLLENFRPGKFTKLTGKKTEGIYPLKKIHVKVKQIRSRGGIKTNKTVRWHVVEPIYKPTYTFDHDKFKIWLNKLIEKTAVQRDYVTKKQDKTA